MITDIGAILSKDEVRTLRRALYKMYCIKNSPRAGFGQMVDDGIIGLWRGFDTATKEWEGRDEEDYR